MHFFPQCHLLKIYPCFSSQGAREAGWDRSGSPFLKGFWGLFWRALWQTKGQSKCHSETSQGGEIKFDKLRLRSSQGQLHSFYPRKWQGAAVPALSWRSTTACSSINCYLSKNIWNNGDSLEKDQGLEILLLPVHFTFFKHNCGKATEHQCKWAVLVTGQSQGTKPPQRGWTPCTTPECAGRWGWGAHDRWGSLAAPKGKDMTIAKSPLSQTPSAASANVSWGSLHKDSDAKFSPGVLIPHRHFNSSCVIECTPCL